MTEQKKEKSKVEQLVDSMVESTVKETMDKLSKTKIVTTKQLTDILDMDGKVLRRHLRNNFAVNHIHQQNWMWTNDDSELVEIVSYFARLSVKKTLVK